MARGPIVTQEFYDHVKEIMNEVPQKEKESLDKYADRLNKKYNKMRSLSPDTYSRIRKSGSLEEYRALIKKKHPNECKKEEQLHMEYNAPDKSSSENAENKNKVVELLEKIWEELVRMNGGVVT